MSVYAKENPQYFAECLDSVLAQTVLPDEIVIVKDGPLTDGLEAALDSFRCAGDLRLIALPENVTQGPARAEGVKAAKYEWVAIMDSDDVCVPDRFEKQIGMIEDDPSLSLIGGQISEFAEGAANAADSDEAVKRLVPTGHDAILKYAGRRNPFNCMTVMMRRDLALSAGNFAYFPWFEDYDLWVRMIRRGAVCANRPDVLVNARVGGGMYSRRRGWTYIRSEVRMQKLLLELGFIGIPGYIANIARRVPVRLLPEKGLRAVYNMFARRR
jgi:glycosyltransferase involved in cell wall biosynthesis